MMYRSELPIGICYLTEENRYLVRHGGDYIGRFETVKEAKAALRTYLKCSYVNWQPVATKLGV